MSTEPEFMTRPWEELASFYRDIPFPATRAIGELCKYIETRPLRSGVHGWQSLHDLCIVQRPATYPYKGPTLLVTPINKSLMVEFRMFDTGLKDRQWNRQEPPDRVIHRFKQTMRQLRWFTDPSVLD